jgi:hypothetical protein
MATESFEGLMQRIADLAARMVPAAVTCGITLAQDGHVVTVASADALARLLDEQQYELDQGPCMEAMSGGKVVVTDDLSREDRWGSYPPRALAHGGPDDFFQPAAGQQQVDRRGQPLRPGCARFR